MLYDILIIDDDFIDDGGSNKGSESENPNAKQLLLDLIKQNLRVTFTTGEKEDLDKLKYKDLSAIRYIFCDLHLAGWQYGHSYKNINSKLLGILGEIGTEIVSREVTLFINSKFAENKDYGDAGKKYLEDGLKKTIPAKKYTTEVIEGKNQLTELQKKELQEAMLPFYAKALIITKATEVENLMAKAVGPEGLCGEKISFDGKFWCYEHKILKKEGEFIGEGEAVRKKIELLQRIRNQLAHSDKLEKIGRKPQKTFWKIVSGKEEARAIEFEDLNALGKYRCSLDDLNALMSKMPQKEGVEVPLSSRVNHSHS